MKTISNDFPLSLDFIYGGSESDFTNGKQMISNDFLNKSKIIGNLY